MRWIILVALLAACFIPTDSRGLKLMIATMFLVHLTGTMVWVYRKRFSDGK